MTTIQITSAESKVLHELALERERKRDEPGWCCRVISPNGACPVGLFDVTRGVVDDAILAAVHTWPVAPGTMNDRFTVTVWRVR